uniref:Uncharacterized protein n=1 Tax=Trichobilharzia regenti TaxID=157069 RepID=A0AA85JUG0_TRIRE|nr:unnamed protein product [Trichobilharzia regenti]
MVLPTLETVCLTLSNIRPYFGPHLHMLLSPDLPAASQVAAPSLTDLERHSTAQKP